MVETSLSLLQFGGVGGVEWIILIAVFIIFLIGSDKMPKIMRTLGKAMGEFEKSRMEIRKEIMRLQQVSTQINPPKPLTPANPSNVKPAIIKPSKPMGNPTKTESRESSQFLLKTASQLGIKTENKSEEEIWEEIKKKILEEKPGETLK